MLAKFSGLNPKGPYVSLEKDKQNFCVVLTYSIKRAREIRKFDVAVVQQRLRNVQKNVIHVERCFFANLNLLFFCCSPSPLHKLPIVVIQGRVVKSCVSPKFEFRNESLESNFSLILFVNKLIIGCS